ncbi:hypothetical protein [Mucilaginibacter gotjawali]|uniref:Uncharacterized protein n=1 Tax=Mucilaginibacter gotjawali TaxID=1550579 RepID=A0A839SF88_9SPHI|nr:hypothetical protein [Mucilaginibacter gotjawali]MBB3055953.1 hypothetical protein [Mucilaginibacter gotjawali]
MSTNLLISVIGAISAIAVSLVAAFYASRNNIVLQTRKLKEDHYVSYIEALHGLMSENKNKESTAKYVFARDKLFIIASEEVVKKILLYESEAVGKSNDLHDRYLTDIVKSIRKDLKIKDKNFPLIWFKKA